MRLVLLVLLLSGCLLPTLLKEPPQTFYAPLPQYQAWWDATTACAGVQGNMGRVQWGVMEDDLDGAFLCARMGPQVKKYDGYCYGAWIEPHLILLSRTHTTNEVTVRHEMLHDLLREVEHTDPRFFSCVGLSANPPTVGGLTF
jgi:hypothetical protein